MAALAACILFSGCAAEAPRAESPTSAPAASSESAPPASQPEASENAREGPGEEAPEPVYADRIQEGTYPIEVSSSSSMFRIVDAQLTVADGEMSAVLTLGGKGYEKLYMGTGEQALADTDDNCIYFTEDDQGRYAYRVPVAALDLETDCAAWSTRKEKWYDRVLVFHSAGLPAGAVSPAPPGKLPADGRYCRRPCRAARAGPLWSPRRRSRSRTEGPRPSSCGAAPTTSPCGWTGRITSPSAGGNSTFEIPVVRRGHGGQRADDRDERAPRRRLYAALRFRDGCAVGAPVKRRLACLAAALLLALSPLSGCAGAPAAGSPGALGNGWLPERSMELRYAENFSVDYYSGGYTLITISDGSRFLTVPQGREAPEGIDGEITVLRRPVENIYLVATSAMCLFDALDGLGSIRLSGTKAGDWYIPGARAAMDAGEILYAGKYNAPDFERILSSSCGLAVESTMINHVPEVREKLEELGIPVLVDQSSYEPHPLGRTEWIKLYGALLGKEDEAERLFAEQAAYLDEAAGAENTGKTVAFFYISSSGYAVARKSGDYVTKMIELAGGNYVFKDLGDPASATSTVPLEMEQFYAAARDADYIIYNSTIGGELSSLDELIDKNGLLRDFRAVQNGNVWCTEKNLSRRRPSSA
ncbi:MAG: ABC transporter substrate-binding protein [Anaerotruncus massiliensis (ex Togo et al. 2019)]